MSFRDASTTTSRTIGKGKVFYGWWIVVACFPLLMWGAGSFLFGFSAFFTPIRREFQWGAAVTSVAFALRGMETGISDPLVGFLLDRFGPRKVMLIGLVIFGAGLIGLGFVNSLWTFYAAVVVIAVGFSGCGSLVGMTAAGNWFVRRRSLVLGITMCGVGMGGVMVPLIAWSISLFGWRSTTVVLGLATWALGIPLSLVLRHKPEQYGYLPDGDPPDRQTPEVKGHNIQPTRQEFGVREALRTPSFWLLTLAFAIAYIGLNGVQPLVIPFLVSVGFSNETASLMVTVMTVSSIAGRLGFGWLGDRIPKRYVLTAIFVIHAGAILMLAAYRGGSLWWLLLSLCIFGPSFGGMMPLRVAIQADYFGRRSLGSLMGIIMGIATLAGMAAPVFAGAVFDATGSYQSAFILLGLIAALAVPMIFLARPPTPPK